MSEGVYWISFFFARRVWVGFQGLREEFLEGGGKSCIILHGLGRVAWFLATKSWLRNILAWLETLDITRYYLWSAFVIMCGFRQACRFANTIEELRAVSNKTTLPLQTAKRKLSEPFLHRGNWITKDVGLGLATANTLQENTQCALIQIILQRKD
jgi:hypothetical protein